MARNQGLHLPQEFYPTPNPIELTVLIDTIEPTGTQAWDYKTYREAKEPSVFVPNQGCGPAKRRFQKKGEPRLIAHRRILLDKNKQLRSIFLSGNRAV